MTTYHDNAKIGAECNLRDSPQSDDKPDDRFWNTSGVPRPPGRKTASTQLAVDLEVGTGGGKKRTVRNFGETPQTGLDAGARITPATCFGTPRESICADWRIRR